MISVSLNLNCYFRKNSLYSKKSGQASISMDPGNILIHEKLNVWEETDFQSQVESNTVKMKDMDKRIIAKVG